MLDARIRLAEAETGYHRARIEYAVALKNVHFENGSLLDHHGTMLADGPSWGETRAEIRQHKLVDETSLQMNYAMAVSPKAPGEQTVVRSDVHGATSPGPNAAPVARESAPELKQESGSAPPEPADAAPPAEMAELIEADKPNAAVQR